MSGNADLKLHIFRFQHLLHPQYPKSPPPSPIPQFRTPNTNFYFNISRKCLFKLAHVQMSEPITPPNTPNSHPPPPNPQPPPPPSPIPQIPTPNTKCYFNISETCLFKIVHVQRFEHITECNRFKTLGTCNFKSACFRHVEINPKKKVKEKSPGRPNS